MKWTEWIRRREKSVPGAFVRFYAVGLVLYMIPWTRPLFVRLTTLSLVAVFGVVFALHRTWNRRTTVWFACIVVSSFLLEWAGVRSGRIFGEYAYGRALAPLVAGTPLVIGFNWLWLVYASHDVAGRVVRRNPVGRVLAGCLLMLLYDYVLEWVAPSMGMWRFGSGTAPLRNYAVWFAAAAVFTTGFEVLGIRSNNLAARVLLGVQLLFFILIGLFTQMTEA